MHFTPLSTCSACDGFLPPQSTLCPHCGQSHAPAPSSSPPSLLKRLGRSAFALGSGALVATTLMACYGAPYETPCEETDSDRDGDCFPIGEDCDDDDMGIQAPDTTQGETCEDVLAESACERTCNQIPQTSTEERALCREDCNRIVQTFNDQVDQATWECIEITKSHSGDAFDTCILEGVHGNTTFPIQIDARDLNEAVNGLDVLLSVSSSNPTTTAVVALSKTVENNSLSDTSPPVTRAYGSPVITVLFDRDKDGICSEEDFVTKPLSLDVGGDYEAPTFKLTIAAEDIGAYTDACVDPFKTQ